MVTTGSVFVGGGGLVKVMTFTCTGGEMVETPRSSVALAVSTYWPSATFVHNMRNGL